MTLVCQVIFQWWANNSHLLCRCLSDHNRIGSSSLLWLGLNRWTKTLARCITWFNKLCSRQLLFHHQLCSNPITLEQHPCQTCLVCRPLSRWCPKSYCHWLMMGQILSNTAGLRQLKYMRCLHRSRTLPHLSMIIKLAAQSKNLRRKIEKSYKLPKY